MLKWRDEEKEAEDGCEVRCLGGDGVFLAGQPQYQCQ